MNATTISAGTGYEYLLKDVAADTYYARGVSEALARVDVIRVELGEARTQLAEASTREVWTAASARVDDLTARLAQAQQDAGEATGRWFGGGLTHVGIIEGSTVEREQMHLMYGLGMHPASTPGDPIVLGRKFAIFRSFDERVAARFAAEAGADDVRRQQIVEELRAADPRLQTLVAAAVAVEPGASSERVREIEMEVRAKWQRDPVAGFDLTFSAPKSVSVLWVGLPEHERRLVLAAQRTAVDVALGEMQAESFVRVGAGGVRQVEVDGGLIVAVFDHKTSRAGDPQLHSHAAVLNRVMGPDGKWLTIDSRALHLRCKQVEYLYDRVLAGELSRLLGVAWAPTPSGRFEIVGIDPETRDMFSSRAVQVRGRFDELVSEHRARHGVVPGKATAAAMLARAKVEGRPRKEPEESSIDMHARWQAAAAANGHDLTVVAEQVRGWVTPPAVLDETALVAAAHAHLGSKVSTIRGPKMVAAVRWAAPIPSGDPMGWAAETRRIAGVALAADVVVRLTPDDGLDVPDMLRRADGVSQYERSGEAAYAARSTIASEDAILDGAQVRLAWQVPGAVISAALAASTCSPDQDAAVRELAGTDRAVGVLIGPAGAGKTFTMKALSQAYIAAGRPVLGLTLAQNAAQILATEAGIETWNMARFRTMNRALPAGGLVIVDEAGMVPTSTLAWVVEAAQQVGSKVLLVGDHQQLDAPEGGGAFRFIAGRVGFSELEEVRRFRASWERAASLRLRDGDVSVLADYDTRHRFREGTEDDLRGALLDTWERETTTGRRSVILCATNEQAATVARDARLRLVAAGRVAPFGVMLRDENTAGRGDVVVTRENQPRLRTPGGVEVVNRARWRVVGTIDDGGLTVVAIDPGSNRVCDGETVDLPGWYVDTAVTLDYASTVDSVQGATVDHAHAWVTAPDGWSRQRLYVALSRGRTSNVAWVPTVPVLDGTEVPTIADPVRVLSGILARTSDNLAALEVLAAEVEAARSMDRLGAVWTDITTIATRESIARTVSQVDDHLAWRLRHSPAWDRLRAAVRHGELCGLDPVALVADVIRRPVGDAGDVGAVLHWRVSSVVGARTPDPFTTWAAMVPAGADEVTAFALRVAERMDARLIELGDRCVLNPPAWAGRLGPIPTGDDLDVWKRRAGLVAGWMEMHMTDRPDGLLGIVPTASRPEVIGLFRSASDALTGADLTVVAELERAAANERLRDVVGPASADLYVARSRLSGMRGEDDAGLAVAVQAGNAARYQLPPDMSGQIREAVIALESADRLLARVDPADTRTRDRAVLAQTNAQGRVTDLEGRQILRQQALEGVAHLVDDGIEAMAEVTRRAGISTTEAWSVRPDWLFPLLDERSAERDELVHDLFVWRGRWGAVNDGSMWGATGFPDPSAVRAREAEREALVERVDPIWQRLSTAAVREYEDARTRHI